MVSLYDEATRLEEQVEIALDELERSSGLTAGEIIELVEYGVFQPQGNAPMEWRFAARCITLGRAASRLRSDFELSAPALALMLSFRERVEELERQVRALEAQLLRG